mmetsp:Transcript_9493/g.10686  ORF Transcript_9493/g.10686 Transcript_9493/m.10686 type:complete len:203 (-) Transcript_9493:53-661(-)
MYLVIVIKNDSLGSDIDLNTDTAFVVASFTISLDISMSTSVVAVIIVVDVEFVFTGGFGVSVDNVASTDSEENVGGDGIKKVDEFVWGWELSNQSTSSEIEDTSANEVINKGEVFDDCWVFSIGEEHQAGNNNKTSNVDQREVAESGVSEGKEIQDGRDEDKTTGDEVNVSEWALSELVGWESSIELLLNLSAGVHLDVGRY